MQRWACGLSYHGGRYHGWQKQTHLRETIEEKLQEALESVADAPCVLCCAGRTDQGVHATGQVVHFESEQKRTAQNWLYGGNALLPEDIKLQWVLPVEDDFHARFSARSRSYCYVIYQNEVSHPLLAGRVWWVRKDLDVNAMQQAANQWLGEFDFSSFRDSDCQAKHAVRKLMNFNIVAQGRFCVFYIEANAFLHHMIRNMMGVLIEIGRGDKPVSWALDVLRAQDRTQAGVTAPPQGLYLCQVSYGLPWANRFPLAMDPFKFVF
ncbi:MAG: tRNA pseudouridine(38-40) synthase TruA [Pseudomonadota bacterium]|nr:tRNA pseudouridine(38-40) synthase TruA [Pseudomonadota bacterium]